VTVFDEVALSNDISAATAGASVSTPTPAAAAPTKSSIEERLQSLEGLRSKGLINETEYTERRNRLLDDV
jgi:hypothetical protein